MLPPASGASLMKPVGLQTRLLRVLALQVVLISVATLVGVYATYRVINDVLIRAALEDEAAHYWQLFEDDAGAPLPNTANLRGYLQRGTEREELPAVLYEQEPGYGRVAMEDGEPRVRVSERGGHRLYLLFQEERVASLVLYFGIVPLGAALATIYILLFLAYRLFRQVVSPIVRLSHALDMLDPSDPGRVRHVLAPHRTSADAEAAAMIDAVTRFAQRLDTLDGNGHLPGMRVMNCAHRLR